MREWISNRGAIFDRFFFDLGPFWAPSWGQDGPLEGPEINQKSIPQNDRKNDAKNDATNDAKIHGTRAVRAVRGAVAEVQRPLQEGFRKVRNIGRDNHKEVG